MRTVKGEQLANAIRETRHEYVDVDVCSRICRAATTYARLQEESCNGHPLQGVYGIPIERVNKAQELWDRRIEREEQRLESLIKRHAIQLPQVKTVLFGGDPRGVTVKLVLKSGRTDDWGQEGICVPGA